MLQKLLHGQGQAVPASRAWQDKCLIVKVVADMGGGLE